MKLGMLALVVGLVGCTSNGGGDDGPSSPDAAYSNHVMLTCNGSVLVDMTFTTKASCDAFKAQNSYMCSGIPLTFSC